MKHSYSFLLALAMAGLALPAAAQIGMGTTTPHPAAALDIVAPDKGLLIPRLDSAARVAIGATPPDGLLVFQTDHRKGFWYALNGGWVYLRDNLGNHSASTDVGLHDHNLRLRARTDDFHALGYYGANATPAKLWNGSDDVDGPVLFGYGGGRLGVSNGGQQSVLAWFSSGNVGIGTLRPDARLHVAGSAQADDNLVVDGNASNSGSLGTDGLRFGSAGSGEGLASNRTNAAAGNNQYGLDFYTGYSRRLAITNGGDVLASRSLSVDFSETNAGGLNAGALRFGSDNSGEGLLSNRTNGAAGTNQYGIDVVTSNLRRLSITGAGRVGIGTAEPSSTLQVAGTVAVGVVNGLAGISGTGAQLGDQPASYIGLAPTAGSGGPGTDYYQLPAPATCPGRVYYLRNNSPTDAAYVGVAGYVTVIYDGAGTTALNTFNMQPTGNTKTATLISDGSAWIAIRTGAL